MPSDKPQRRTDLVVQRAGRELLVYSSGSATEPGGAVHALNPTAALIWDLSDGAHTLAEIEATVRHTFAVPADRDLTADILDITARLRSQGLLED